MTITRPCYATREQVMRAVDIKYAAHMFDAVDRAIESASDDVDGFMKRHFYPLDQTISFDWPNRDSPTPWRLWLNQYELAAQPTLVVSGTNLPSPIVITPAQYVLYPSSGPPWNRLELRRDLSATFGNNTTPQNDTAITGTYGYWMRTRAAGKLAVAMADTTGTTAQVSNSNLVGVGDLMIIGTERLLVTGKSMVSTTVTVSGLTTAQANDNTLAVPDATVFTLGEVLLYDSERVLIVDIAGNNLYVKRGWDGTTLTDHTSGTLYADRLLTVTRGDFGSVAATHLINAAVTVNLVPSQIRDLALGEAIVQTAQEVGAYSGGQGGSGAISDIGSSLADKWEETETLYGRKVRMRSV